VREDFVEAFSRYRENERTDLGECVSIGPSKKTQQRASYGLIISTITTSNRRAVEERLALVLPAWIHDNATCRLKKEGIPSMSFLEWLRNGSDFHQVSPLPDVFTIRAANDSEECREHFHEIVEEAIKNASVERYKIKPHPSSMDPRGRWDFAIITSPPRAGR
jgi:hypothetical protein